ncbi:sigma-70 family RNA polymerase sigma factor [Bacillaceae bacterium W0354]
MKQNTTIHVEFADLVKEYERMIYYLIHKLNINDQDGEFFQEGVIALWEAYQKYGDRKTFGKLAYITINSRLIDLIRKNSRINEHEAVSDYIKEDISHDQNIENFDPGFWSTVRNSLTEKQWIFVKKRIIEGKAYKDIAAEENTTIDAVKGWGKEVKRKLQPVLKEFM